MIPRSSMIPLPIDPSLPAIVEALRVHRAVVVVAPPGAGKSTRVPPALLVSGLLATEHPAVVLLQPRRVAARATAARIADEQGWTLGRQVGFQVRFERRVTAKTRLRVQTEGVLLRQLLSDPLLNGVGAVVLDEFHERSLQTDLALALLSEIRRDVRPDLLLVVMSATLETGPVSAALGGCPVVGVEGPAYPVAVTYRPSLRPASPEAIVPEVQRSLDADDGQGHILVFLPGMAEIRRNQRALEPIAAERGAVVLPLHGSLPAAEQDRALRPSELRKVILATNVAETSLTIDGVTEVIDSGLARLASYDAPRGIDRLVLSKVSRASADQRAGRAGRTGPGRCVRLWSEREHRARPEFEVPEVQRVDLSGPVLALRAWGIQDLAAFGWFEPPAASRLEEADRLLTLLGALDPRDRRITPVGRRMLDLPVHPRLARLLLAATDSRRTSEGAALVALLAEKEILLEAPAERSPFSSRHNALASGPCDLLPRLDLLAEAEASRFAPAVLRARGIDPVAARRVTRLRDELQRLVSLGTGNLPHPLGDDDQEAPLRWLLLAYPDRVARRRGAEGTAVMVGGRGVRLHPSSRVRDREFFVALDPREERRQGKLELHVRLASAIHPEWLEEEFPEALHREVGPVFDPVRSRVVGRTRLWYHDLLLREDQSGQVEAAEASRLLAEALRDQAVALFHDDSAAVSWLARYEFVRSSLPELGWPELGEPEFQQLLPRLCEGCREVAQVRQAAKVPLLEDLLAPAQRRELNQSAPAALRIPSGRLVNLIYEPGRPPVLAARIQELFGWKETPRVARGRVPILLHLLAPNHRPAQITSDLASFWATTYHQVRKELRGRYPKHDWPENPQAAQPRSNRRAPS